MYKYIKGIVDEIGGNYIVLNNNDIGYLIMSSSNTLDKLSLGNETKIFTHLHVRDDEMSLYGFNTLNELNLYKLLLSVSKVGPKVGLSILSELSTDEVKKAILMEDSKPLSKASGVGSKTAKRIILELKDKIDDNILISSNDSAIIDSNVDEVLYALQALGYSKMEISSVLKKIDCSVDKTEDIIKLALKELAKR